MSIWQRLMNLIGKRPTPGPRTYELSESLQVTLSTLAQHEGRTEEELIPDILAAGLIQYRSVEELWPKWESLSPREQDVTALTCLGYTNREMAERLHLSPETIKKYLHSALIKFDLRRKSDLRHILAAWNFSRWI